MVCHRAAAADVGAAVGAAAAADAAGVRTLGWVAAVVKRRPRCEREEPRRPCMTCAGRGKRVGKGNCHSCVSALRYGGQCPACQTTRVRCCYMLCVDGHDAWLCRSGYYMCLHSPSLSKGHGTSWHRFRVSRHVESRLDGDDVKLRGSVALTLKFLVVCDKVETASQSIKIHKLYDWKPIVTVALSLMSMLSWHLRLCDGKGFACHLTSTFLQGGGKGFACNRVCRE